MDGENVPDEENVAALAVGASVIERWSTLYPALLGSGLADDFVSCYDCYPMVGCPASFSKFELGG